MLTKEVFNFDKNRIDSNFDLKKYTHILSTHKIKKICKLKN